MIPWTTDGLAESASSTVVDTVRISDEEGYQLVQDRKPDRWYIRRVDASGARAARSIVYPSRNSPGLMAAWNSLKGPPYLAD